MPSKAAVLSFIRILKSWTAAYKLCSMASKLPASFEPDFRNFALRESVNTDRENAAKEAYQLRKSATNSHSLSRNDKLEQTSRLFTTLSRCRPKSNWQA